MGRIADALRRAQEERARRAAGAVAVGEPAASTSVDAPSPESRFASGGESTDVLGQASILEAPPSPQPIPIQADPILPEAVDPRVVAFHDSTGEIAERYRSTRTRLLTGNPAGSARLLAITSTLRKEGKTITTANLGFSMAELRHLRVAMIDLDFRQRGLSRYLQVDEKPGIADVLRGERQLAEVCIPAVRENLFFIPAGDTGGARPSDLLARESVGAVFREFNERFHYSLIDTPPVNTSADLGLIAPLCHSVLIVVRMHRTPESSLCRCVKMLQANRISIAGCVLAGYSESTMSYDAHDYFETTP